MRIVGALLAASHPLPTIAVTAVTVLLGVAAGLDDGRVALLGGAMLLGQLSIGISNDAIDAARDRAAGRSDKPLARGEVPVRVAASVAGVLAVASLLAPLPLGIPVTLAHAIAIAGGWVYNVGAKATVFSAVPYAVSFGLLPALATLARPEPALPAAWAVAAGALLGVAAHIANALPDLDDDRATGVRGMPHRLGPRASTVVAGVALAGAAVALALGLGVTVVSLAGLGLSLAASAAAVVLGLRGSRLAFRLVMLAALVDVVLLVLAGGRMAG